MGSNPTLVPRNAAACCCGVYFLEQQKMNIPTPKEKQEQLNKTHAESIEKLMSECVSAIEHSDSMSITITLRSKGYSKAAIDHVVGKLKEADWVVEHKSNKGGASLVISAE